MKHGNRNIPAFGIEAIPAAAVLTAEGGMIIQANSRFHMMLGYNDGELAGRDCRMLSASYQEIQEAGEVLSTELFSSEGSPVSVTLESKRITEAGTTPYYVTVAHPAGVNTREEAYWKTFFTHAREGIVIINRDHQITAANPSFCAMLGYSEEELLSMHTWDYDAYLDEEEVRKNFILSEDMNMVVESRHVRKDGSEYDVEVSITGLRDAHLGLFMCICRDITEKKRYESERDESAQQIIELLERIKDGFISLDTQWRYTYMNSKAAEMLGSDQEELLGKCIWEVFPELKDTPFCRAVTRSYYIQENIDIRDYFADADEWYEARIYPSQYGVSIFIYLITDEVRAEEQEEFRHAFQKLIAETSSEFIAASPLRFSMTVDRMLMRFGEFLKADRCYLVRLTPESRTFSITNQWNAPGIPAHKDLFQQVTSDIYPWLSKQISMREPVCVEDMKSLPGEASREKHDLLKLGVKSIALFPVFVQGRIQGMLGIETLEERKTWDAELISLLQLASAITAEALKKDAMEKELISGRRRLADIIKATNVGTWEWDFPSGRITCNRRFAEIIGYKPEELAPFTIEKWRSLCPPDEVKASGKLLEEHIAGKLDYYEFEGRMQHKHGSWVWVLNRGSIVSREDSSGNPLVISGTVQDITERKTSEEQLRHSYELMRYIIEHTPSAVAVHDRELRYIFVSQKYLEEFQVADTDIIGKHHYEVFPDLPEKYRKVHQRCLQGEVVRDKDDLFPRGDGRVDWTTWECRPWYEADGSIGGIVLYTEIVTERLQAEEERLQLQNQLAQSSKMESVGRLAGGVAHDFNNMLQAIMGHAEMALDAISESHELWEDLSSIQLAAAKSAELTRQLLTFARKQAVTPQPVNLNTVVSGMTSMLERMIGETVALAWKPADELWNVMIDPAQADQILINLCVNARDAAGDGGEILIWTENQSDEHGEYVLLGVEDNGCGMDEETLKNVYEPFFTTKTVGEGSGLGLPMVYGIVSQNNGMIHISSTPGEGTTVRIMFPRTSESSSQQIRKTQALRGIKTEGKNVLIAEDEKAVLSLVKSLLIQQGHRVFAADSPLEAAETAKARQNEIDLLITDVVMPGMNGLELYNTIKGYQKFLRVLFISGYTADILSLENTLSPGMEVLAKPFTAQALREKILELFSGDKAEKP